MCYKCSISRSSGTLGVEYDALCIMHMPTTRVWRLESLCKDKSTPESGKVLKLKIGGVYAYSVNVLQNAACVPTPYRM